MQHVLDAPIADVAPRTATVGAGVPQAPAPDPEEALSQLFAGMSERRQDLGAAVVVDPGLLLRMLRLLRELPAIRVELPRSGDHREVARALKGYAASRRLTLGVTAVLELPRRPGGYTDGPSRSTVRRKVRAAERQGIVVRPVPEADRAAVLALANAHERENLREQYRSADPRNDDLLDYPLWLAAHDATGAPIVLAVIPVSGTWATLRYFRTLVPGQASSDARWLLAAELAETLRATGVHRLVDATRPHWLPNGLRHFQRMLGFRLVRLSAPRVVRP